MSIGSLFLLLFVVVCGVGALYIMAANMPMSAPVDSYGVTVNTSDNATRTAAINTIALGNPIGSYIVLIISVLILITVVIFFTKASSKGSSQSRYR